MSERLDLSWAETGAEGCYRRGMLGVGIALGAGIGTVLFAITGEAFWIAVGPSFGVMIGLLMGEIRGEDDEDDD